jgi:signal transduction histidine kinase
VFASLAENVALFVALSVAYQWIMRRWQKWTVPRQVVSGALFGLIAVVGMMTPFRPAPGIQYDGRSIIIAIAGVFGGPVVAVVAGLIAAAYRLYLGGAGQWAGVAVVAESAALGVGYHYLRRRWPDATRWPPLLGLALLVHATMLVIQLWLPGGVGPSIVRQIWFPVLVLYPGGMLLVCRLMIEQERTIEDEQELRDLNDSLERIVDERTEELQAANEQLLAASDELRGANEELRDASEAKSQFLRAMSHELRTPLNSIIGFSDLLLRGQAGAVNEEQKKQLEMVNGSGRRLLAMIGDVLDLSRIEAHAIPLAFETFDAADLVRQTAESIRPSASAKGLAVTVDVTDDPVTITSDPLKVGQILLNLLSNAVKFTHSGSVTARVRRRGHGVVAFEVTDTGAGVSEEMQKQIFGEFVQQDDRVEGAGLGLAISRALAELLGGTVLLESRPGEGSTFTLLLPEDSSVATRG